MNKHAIKRAVTVLALGALMSACASPAPHWDTSFGSSVRASRDAQVLHPDAALSAPAVTGTDGRSARAAHAAYEASFTTPKASETSMIRGSTQ